MNETDIGKIDLNLLKALKVLLDERHVGRSADRMNISQSAMSHTLARLRTAFNDPLFIRKSTGLEPTKRAIELGSSLGELLTDISRLFSTQTFEPASINTHFRIQTHDFVASDILAPKLSHIQSLAPNITFDLKIINQDCYTKVNKGETDLIVGAGLSAPQNFIQREVTQEPIVCLLDKKNPALKNWGIDTLFEYPHIKLSLLSEKDDPVSKYANKNGLPKRIISFYTASLQMQPALIAGTQNIAFLPERFAKHAAKALSLKIMPCPIEIPPVSIKGLWHHRSQSDSAHKWIRDIIISQLP